MHQTLLHKITEHKQRILNELFELLRIPSVSADSRYQQDVFKAAVYIKDNLIKIGIKNAQLLETEGFPVVYGHLEINPMYPTVLVYGHYDVQPPDPLNEWKTPPFEPTIIDDKIYCRGACDDKGQMFMHLKAVELMQEIGELNCNVKFFIEGEEEVGSASLALAVDKYRHLLDCDVMLISDTSMIDNDKPSLCIGLRGLAYFEVLVEGPNRDLHSGTYGGAVDNPINVLSDMISKLKDENRRITIPGFYDDVITLSEDERKELLRIPFDERAYLNHLNIKQTRGEKNYTIIEQTSVRPTLEINGIWGGYIGEGAKTVLPARAAAKISMRLVPNQDYNKIIEQFTTYFKSLAPNSVNVTVKALHGGLPFLTDTKSAGYKAAEEAMLQTFGVKPIPTREGGSIPILALFVEKLKVPIVLMGFGLDTDAIHSPNEHFGLFNFFKGIETIGVFYEKLFQIFMTEKQKVTVNN